jgi:cold shock protein
MSNRDYGTIQFWSNDRHYGFLRPDHGDRDVFVHGSAFPEGEEPRIGDRVTFEIGADRRPGRDPRVCAINARFVNGDGA